MAKRISQMMKKYNVYIEELIGRSRKMTNKVSLKKRIVSVIVCMAVLLSTLPFSAMTASADARATANIVVDRGTAHTFENMMGTDSDGNRYAGRVWADKSVYKDGDTVLLNTKGEASSSFNVNLEQDEDFQIVFSVLGSSMSTTTTTTSSGPMDVVLVIDSSVSMTTTSGGVTRLQRVVEAANKLISQLLEGSDVRIGLVSYNSNSRTILPFGYYKNGVTLRVNSYSQNDGVIRAYDDDNNLLGQDGGFNNGTNVQSGVNMGMRMLANATNTAGRNPVAIVLTDGAANHAVNDNVFEVEKGTIRQVFYDDVPVGVALSTLLNASFMKATVEDHYGKSPMVYGVGVDLSTTDGSTAIINPADTRNGFNANNSHENIRTAYGHYINTWTKGSNVSISQGNGWGAYSWNFNHTYPSGSKVTDADIMANINYVDHYYNVTSAQLDGAFDQIYEELSSAAFNPISTSNTTVGGTGVDNTPLVYVDDIGEYMEIKEIEAITLFGRSYNVLKDENGKYTVAGGTGTNPTTNEKWNTAEDIRISVEGQRLKIEIEQEILPIILEKVKSDTVGDVNTSTITEILQEPLRVYYTVGIKSSVLLANGEIDLSKIDSSYLKHVNGNQINFYSNSFGNFNPDENGDGRFDLGDAHVGFKPSDANRYYYHQTNQGIFTEVKSKIQQTIDWDASEYGVVWDESKYDLTWMSYADYKSAQSGDTVYTYVTYYHPTPVATDAASAAEKVTYLVYTDWEYLKHSIAFYNETTKQYLNDGKVMSETEIDNYVANNPNAEIYAVLGVGSKRISRLHNMIVSKTVQGDALSGNHTSTAEARYAPEYTGEKASEHENDNEVVIWLGNNGRLTTTIDTGIALNKTVTEAIGNANDTYDLTLSFEQSVNANPVVKDSSGNQLASNLVSFASEGGKNVLTVKVKADQTVYVSGIPAGTVCEIGEKIPVGAPYHINSKTNTVTVPTLAQVLAKTSEQYVVANVENAPFRFGNLYVTKEFESDHVIPQSIYNEDFEIEVNVGSLTGEYTLKKTGEPDSTIAVVGGKLNFTIKARQTAEILGLPEGLEVTVTENLTNAQKEFFDNNPVYHTRDYTGANLETNSDVTITANSNSTAIITNKYIPKKATVDLDISGTKYFKGDTGITLPEAKFVFEVQKHGANGWDTFKDVEVDFTAGQTTPETFTINNVLGGVDFTEVGTTAYQVVEKKGNVDHITYDRTVYAFDVEVVDNGGQLEAKVFDRNGNIINNGVYENVNFENTYNTATVSVDIVKKVNEADYPDMHKENFRFKAVATDSNWNKLTGSGAYEEILVSDAEGEARFVPQPFTAIGDYYYTITEIDDDKAGWDYSNAEYRVKVAVQKDGEDFVATTTITAKDGSLKNGEEYSVNANDATKGEVVFVNKYTAESTKIEAGVDFSVKKILDGKTLNENDFTFKIYKNNTNEEVKSAKNDAQGNVDFGTLTFDKPDKYEYDIVEIKDGKAGIAYDNTIYDLVVEVTNNYETGKLEAVAYFEDSVETTVTFKNKYTVEPCDYVISGTKVLTGRAVGAHEFEFELYDDDNDVSIETVSNKGDGSFAFKALSFTKVGTHNYIIKEVGGNIPGVTYTTDQIKVKIEVKDENAKLKPYVTVENENSKYSDQVKFENKYVPASAKVKFEGTKEFVGGTIEKDLFNFKLYETDNNFDIENPKDTKSVKNDQNGKFEFLLDFDKTGTYFYSIVEDDTAVIENVVYDNSKHNFIVKVTDIGDGQLKASVQNTNSATASQALAQVVEKVGFKNATFDEVTEKEVRKDENTSIKIDGVKVKKGDILTYFITYNNYTGEDVVVDIMDRIPEYTSYVEGSAVPDATYAGGQLNWILNVAKDKSVTVWFKVKVEVSDEIIANTAYVYDGYNSYVTNEVNNHTVENEVKKDVVNAKDVNVSIDGKQVKSGDEIIYKISYTNITGKKTDVKFKDTIPANTSYVEGSADNGGQYNNGEIVWEIKDVEAWSTVTVGFKVKVNEVVENATLENVATVIDDFNNFSTNEVLNPVSVANEENPEKPQPIDKEENELELGAKKDKTDKEAPSSPQTGDDFTLWLALLFVTSGSVFGATLLNKKKRKHYEN